MSKPFLSVVVITYNHEAFIKQALDSILSQDTNFDFEVIVGEDHSTDGTLAICKSFGENINLMSSGKNVGMTANFISCLDAAKGTYIAVCDGDDYWTDPLKLQKQVDFLEKNKEYYISWTNYKILEGNILLKNEFGHKEALTTIDYTTIFSPYCTLTLTSVFRKNAINLDVLKSLKHFKDNSLYIMALENGKGVFMDFESAVYRIHEGGVFSLQSQFFKSYSSYMNLKEITDAIPASQTDNIKKTIRSLGNAAAFSALKSKYNGDQLTEVQENFIENHFKQSPFKTKFKYYKRLFKYKYLK